MGTTGVMGMDKNHTSEGWYLDLILVIRSLGSPGQASISTTGSLSWIKKQMGASEQYDLNNINATSFNTDTTANFGLVARWSNGASAADSITLTNCVISKLF